MMRNYFKVMSLVERLHRSFLELVKLELDRVGLYDINNVQALMLFSMGEAKMTVSELMTRGCYLGSNVSYNVRKLVENGYLEQTRSTHDRRSVHVKLTMKGNNLLEQLSAMHSRHLEMLSQSHVTDADLTLAASTLRRLDRFLTAGDLAEERRRA
jgi:DNA-binding MarR family transcriptional regulator